MTQLWGPDKWVAIHRQALDIDVRHEKERAHAFAMSLSLNLHSVIVATLQETLSKYLIDLIAIDTTKFSLVCNLATGPRKFGIVCMDRGTCIFVINGLRSSCSEFRIPVAKLEAFARMLRVEWSCMGCSRIATDSLTCTGCHSVRYCDKKCLKENWREHKLQCMLWRNRRLTSDYEKVSSKNYPNLFPLQEESRLSRLLPIKEEYDVEYWRLCKKIVYRDWSLIELPRDILLVILDYLDPFTRALTREVCSTLKRIVGHNSRDKRSYFVAARYGNVFGIELYYSRCSSTCSTNARTFETWIKAIGGMLTRATIWDRVNVIEWACTRAKPLLPREYNDERHAESIKGILCTAIRHGAIRIVEYLVRRYLLPRLHVKGAKHKYYLNEGLWIIREAVEYSQIDIVKMMLGFGYNLSKRRLKNIGDRSPNVKAYLRSIKR